MASLRRSKALSPDGQTARFLYTILKQLDLKTVDWLEVAESLGITNGHAARMRYSRFKQQIEGLPGQVRAPRAKKDGHQRSSALKGKRKLEEHEDDDGSEGVKLEHGNEQKRVKVEERPHAQAQALIKAEPTFKLEEQDMDIPGTTIKTEPNASDFTPESLGLAPPMYIPASPANVTASAGAARPSPLSTPAPTPATVSMADLSLPARPRQPAPRPLPYHCPRPYPNHRYTVGQPFIPVDQNMSLPRYPTNQHFAPAYEFQIPHASRAIPSYFPMPDHAAEPTLL